MIRLLVLTIGLHAATLEVLDPVVRTIVGPRARLVEIARHQTWTEGPLPLPDGRLLFADIKSNSIRAVDGGGHVDVLRSPSGYLGREPYPGPEPGSSAMVRDGDGKILVAGHAGRAIFRYRDVPSLTIERETLVDRFEGKRLNSPNDLVLARDGAIWFTDPPFGLPSQRMADKNRELEFAGVFRLSHPGKPDQRLELVSRDLRGPNGLAFSPDQKTLYVANTPAKTWVQFQVGADGALTGPKPFAAVGADTRAGEPDGLKVDRAGHVFAAGPGGVWIFDAHGKRLGTIIVPKRTTNVAFAGRRLFITAGDSIYAIDTKIGE